MEEVVMARERQQTLTYQLLQDSYSRKYRVRYRTGIFRQYIEEGCSDGRWHKWFATKDEAESAIADVVAWKRNKTTASPPVQVVL